jgi:hypothetical protein
VHSDRDGISPWELSEEDCPAGIICTPGAGLYYAESVPLVPRVSSGQEIQIPKLRVGGILNPQLIQSVHPKKSPYRSRAWSTEDIISVLRDRICENAHVYASSSSRRYGKRMKMLAAMDRARDNFEFSARMSHEVRDWALASTIALKHRSTPSSSVQQLHSVSMLTTSPDRSPAMKCSPAHEISYLTLPL